MKRLYLTSVSALLLLTGCEQLQSLLDRQISVPDTSQLIQTVSAESTEGETTIDFITQDAWQAAISQPGEERIPEWLSVSPESGDEGGTYSMHQGAEKRCERSAVYIRCNGVGRKYKDKYRCLRIYVLQCNVAGKYRNSNCRSWSKRKRNQGWYRIRGFRYDLLSENADKC